MRLPPVDRCPDIEMRGPKVPNIQGAAWGVRRRATKIQGQVARAGAADAGALPSESTPEENAFCSAALVSSRNVLHSVHSEDGLHA